MYDLQGRFTLENVPGRLLHCVRQIGSVEQVTERNEMHLSILQQQAEQEEKMVNEAKETSELMKKVGTPSSQLL